MTKRTATRRSYDTVATDYAAEIGDQLRRKPLDRRAGLELVARIDRKLISVRSTLVSACYLLVRPV
jgi:hypothetical protein